MTALARSPFARSEEWLSAESHPSTNASVAMSCPYTNA